MFTLDVSLIAQDDLNGMRLSSNHADVGAAAIIYVFLEQLKEDQYLLDSMTIHKFSDDVIDVEHYAALWKGRNLWRMKLIDLIDLGLPYRIIYAFEPLIKRYHILGVVNRDFKYDITDPRTQRIIDAYDDLDIPAY